MDNEHLKKEVMAACFSNLETKFASLTKELDSLRESAESDTKSSMGDKYETGREMVMQERMKLEDQKALIAKQISFLKSIDLNKNYSKVEFGALAITNTATYFICIPIGLLEVDVNKIFVISANSPIGQVLLGKSVGEKIEFNGREISLLDIK